MDGAVLPVGRLLAADERRVFVATGFGIAGTGPEDYRLRALDRRNGATLWTLRRSSPVFVQGIVNDVLVASEQYTTLLGLDAATGTERWQLDLAGIGLNGYGANTSAASGDVMAVGLSAPGEGNTAPPVVIGLDPATGALRWRAALAPGTDLTLGAPTLVDGAAVFLSTLSHPGSASGNMAHAVDLRDGAVRWAVESGGGQGFHAMAAAVSAGGVHLPTPGEIITVDPATGSVRWRRPGQLPTAVTVGAQLWIFELNRIVVVDPLTGDELAASTIAADTLAQPVALSTHRVLAFRRNGSLAVRGPKLRVVWTLKWGRPVDVPLVSGDLVIVSTADRAVAAYSIGRSRPS